MKKNIIPLVGLFLVIFSSCKKKEISAYSEPVEVRTSKFLQEYQEVLTSASNGWKVILKPNQKNIYMFWMKFDKQNRVQMMVDINRNTATTVKESSYRMKSIQAPMLLFDTYNYIHLIADPDPSISKSSSTGTGLRSDYQFYPDSATVRAIQNKKIGDTLELVGQVNGVRIKMVKATPEEENAYKRGDLFQNMRKFATYFGAHSNTITIGGKTIELKMFHSLRILNFKASDDNTRGWFQYFLHTLGDFNFAEPYDTGVGKIIVGLRLDSEKNILYAVFDDGSTQPFDGTFVPLHTSIGNSIRELTIQDAATYEGWSQDFIDRKAQASEDINTEFGLRLGAMLMRFSSPNSSFILDATVYRGTSPIRASYGYYYTKTEAGEFKFNLLFPNSNGRRISFEMRPLLSRIDNDRFTVDYFTTTSGETLAKFTSVERPEFSFTAVY